VATPNQVWVGYITYIPTEEGELFLAVVLDRFSRPVVRWSMRADMGRELVIDALNMAWFRRSRSAFTAFDQMEIPAPTSRMLATRSMMMASIPIRRRATAAASPPIPAPIIATRTSPSLTRSLRVRCDVNVLAFGTGQRGQKVRRVRTQPDCAWETRFPENVSAYRAQAHGS